ncbi:MAG: DUF3084 domain-containing protein [Thermaceae bacterium]
MTLVWLLVLLAVLSGLVAYLGDRVAKWVGKRHWRLLHLRPRQTATLVAVLTGVFIGLMGFGLFLLVNQKARQTILEAERVREERDALLFERDRLVQAREALEREAARALAELNRLRMEEEERAHLLERAEARRKALEEEISGLKAELQEVRRRLADRETRLFELSRRIALKERVVSDKEATVQELEGRIQALEAKRRYLEEEARRAKAEKERLVREARAQTEALAALSREREGLLAERKALEERLRALLAQNRVLEEKGRLLARDLDRLGRRVQLGGVVFEREEEVRAFADRQARLWGFSGAFLQDKVKGPGYAVLHGEGVVSGERPGESRLLVGAKVYPRRQAFTLGSILAFAELPSPESKRFLQGLEALYEKARRRLLAAGFPPEFLLFPQEEALAFQKSLQGVRQGMVVGVVAERELWTDRPPDLLFLALFTLP